MCFDRDGDGDAANRTATQAAMFICFLWRAVRWAATGSLHGRGPSMTSSGQAMVESGSPGFGYSRQRHGAALDADGEKRRSPSMSESPLFQQDVCNSLVAIAIYLALSAPSVHYTCYQDKEGP